MFPLCPPGNGATSAPTCAARAEAHARSKTVRGGRRPGGGDDARGPVLERGDVERVLDDRGEVVADEEVEVGDPPVGHRLRGQTGFDVGAAGVDAEGPGDLREGGREAAFEVELPQGGEFALVVRAVGLGQEARGDGLVGDQGAELSGVSRGHVQADDGAEAAAEHQGGCGRERGQQAVDVVAVFGEGRAPAGGVEPAAGQPAAVVGEHGVGAGEVGDEAGGAVGVALAALRDEQQRSGALESVVQDDAGHGERAGGEGGGGGPGRGGAGHGGPPCPRRSLRRVLPPR